MAQSFGNLCRELIGGSLQIKSQLVIDSNVNVTNVCNLTAKAITITDDLVVLGNSQMGNLLVPDMIGNICADKVATASLEEKIIDDGILINGNLIMGNNNVIANNGFVCANSILTNQIQLKSNTQPYILVTNNARFQCNVHIDKNLRITNGNIRMGYGMDDAAGVNPFEYEATVNNPSGNIKMCNIDIPPAAPVQPIRVHLTNSHVNPFSVINASIAHYSSNDGNGVPVITQVNPGVGEANIIITNLDVTQILTTSIAQFWLNFVLF